MSKSSDEKSGAMENALNLDFSLKILFGMHELQKITRMTYIVPLPVYCKIRTGTDFGLTDLDVMVRMNYCTC